MVTYQPYYSAPAQPSPPALDMPHYGIGFIDAIKRGFKKYATFSGRASRSEYWWWALFSFIVYLVLLVPAYVLGITTSSDGGRTPGAAATADHPVGRLLPSDDRADPCIDCSPAARRWIQRMVGPSHAGALRGWFDPFDLYGAAELARWSQVRPGTGNSIWRQPVSAQSPYPRKARTLRRTPTHHKPRSGSHQTAPGDQNPAAATARSRTDWRRPTLRR